MKYPEIKVELVGQDGNAFAILSRVGKAMKEYGLDADVRKEFFGADPRLLDIHGALDRLPELPLKGKPHRQSAVTRVTGTHDSRPGQFAPGFAPNSGKPSTTIVNCGQTD